jgi:hypothetical protein
MDQRLLGEAKFVRDRGDARPIKAALGELALGDPQELASRIADRFRNNPNPMT